MNYIKEYFHLRVWTLDQRSLEEKVETINPIITISAESKGPLVRDEVFSFGNGGGESNVGYVVIRRGYITGISLSSEKSNGEVQVGVLVNGNVLKGCEITLNSTPRKYDTFESQCLVKPESVINFVSLSDNRE